MDHITFENLPVAVGEIMDRLLRIEKLLKSLSTSDYSTKHLMTISEAAQFLRKCRLPIVLYQVRPELFCEVMTSDNISPSEVQKHSFCGSIIGYTILAHNSGLTHGGNKSRVRISRVHPRIFHKKMQVLPALHFEVLPIAGFLHHLSQKIASEYYWNLCYNKRETSYKKLFKARLISLNNWKVLNCSVC